MANCAVNKIGEMEAAFDGGMRRARALGAPDPLSAKLPGIGNVAYR
jgi:hypothetical protein